MNFLINLYLLISIINLTGSTNVWLHYLRNNATKLEASRCRQPFYLNQLDLYKQTLIDVDLSMNKIVDIAFTRSFTKLKTLNLATNLIKNLEPLKQLIELERLDLSHNLINDLKPIENLFNLIKLKIYDNRIKSIDAILTNLYNLISIDASDNEINQIQIDSSMFNYSTSLLDLELTNNFLDNIDSLAHLSKLKKLHVNKNKIRYLSRQIMQRLDDLEFFHIEFNLIEKFEEINTNENRKWDYLNFGSNLITNIDFICKNYRFITKIKYLMFKKNLIENADCTLSLTNLITLDLNTNRVKKLNYLDNLDSLIVLDLGFNQLNELKVNKSLTNLNYLSLRSNNVSNIEFISKFTGLTILDLANNFITDIDILKNMTNLIHLNLSFNQIENVSVLKHLNNLSSLLISHNKIYDLNSIKNVHSLIRIEANYNQLTNIDVIKHLTRLIIVELSNNRIEFVDDYLFDELFSLRRLEMSSNRIKTLKLTSNNMSNINFLNISFNRFDSVDFMTNLFKLKNVIVNNNKIDQFNFNIISNKKDLFRIDLSFNQIESFNLIEFNISKHPNLKFIYIDTNFKDYFSIFNNDIVAKRNEAFTFIKSLFILTKNELTFFDCKLIFNYLKKNIHFNLFYNDQIDRFLATCTLSLDL
jgi:internalin A